MISHTRGYGNGEKPEDYLDAFSAYVNTNMNEIAALNIVCTRPKDLTREDLKSLRLILTGRDLHNSSLILLFLR